ncbi:MAG: methyl-accepting chemotaxis protein [Lachnospiraceae bacterium]|uniref:Methyl-accepting chemotaxis protein n=1 Tax=Candidatus Weimeria bifida TaxID=2599074 RepID=A0A6N7J194_9FIRM|nr:methyl-accepting chemotaxis protein [Candidatus Weimeria bifida]RRF96526.1 MAG: methyl-accepting chemotaxis protein [Lachnospiraceae bacterium]
MSKQEGLAKKTKGYRSVGRSIMMMNLVIVIIVSVVVSAISIISLNVSFKRSMDVYHKAKLDGYKREIVSETQSAISIVQKDYDDYRHGDLTEEQAKKEAEEDIKRFRYRDDQSGYFWIDDLDYNLVMHPILTEQQGKNRKNLQDKKGNMIIQMIRKSCTSSKKGGFNEFYFTKADGKTVAPKLAYSQLFEPWGWMLSTGNYTDDMNKEMAATEKSLSSLNRIMTLVTFIVMAICIVVSGFLSYALGKKTVAPLTNIQKFAQRMAKGDLRESIEVKTKNEFGDTGRGLNEAQKNMENMILRASNACESLKKSIEEFSNNFSSMSDAISNVSSAVNDIAENNTDQAKAAADAVSEIETLSGNIDDSSSNVAALDSNASDMMECSKESKNTLQELVEKNKATMDDIQTMSAQTQQTSDSVAKIAEAANLISDIASQTNLLSLNASIEAARAGEAGRGFAVVAEEIGNLANQSDESAKTINSIVEELVKNSTQQVEIMKRMQSVSQEQVDAFNRTRETFVRLETSLDNCSTSADSISENIHTMEGERDRIKNNIESLNDDATDNAASTEETSSMAAELESEVNKSRELIKDLEDQLTVLNEAMSIFKV